MRDRPSRPERLGWALVGAPLDSAGAGEGEERAPAALRAAGVARALGAVDDLGDVTEPLRPAVRDAETGVIAYRAVLAASLALREAVAGVVREGRRPLVLGGDCSLLPGALAGCRHAGIAPGLWMVDGHADAFDGTTSPTGEAADLDLAIVCGRGPEPLVGLGAPAAQPPLVEPARVALLGLRPRGYEADNDRDLDGIDADVWQRDAPSVVAEGPALVGLQAAARLQAHPVWLHLDLDVLDGSVMPAVSYPQPYGLGWDELEQLLTPLAAAPTLVGCSVSDLDADADPHGVFAARTVELLERVLAG
jgi:arginase